MEQVHGRVLKEVPNALPGRNDPRMLIIGLKGVPPLRIGFQLVSCRHPDCPANSSCKLKDVHVLNQKPKFSFGTVLCSIQPGTEIVPVQFRKKYGFQWQEEIKKKNQIIFCCALTY